MRSQSPSCLSFFTLILFSAENARKDYSNVFGPTGYHPELQLIYDCGRSIDRVIFVISIEMLISGWRGTLAQVLGQLRISLRLGPRLQKHALAFTKPWMHPSAQPQRLPSLSLRMPNAIFLRFPYFEFEPFLPPLQLSDRNLRAPPINSPLDQRARASVCSLDRSIFEKRGAASFLPIL